MRSTPNGEPNPDKPCPICSAPRVAKFPPSQKGRPAWTCRPCLSARELERRVRMRTTDEAWSLRERSTKRAWARSERGKDCKRKQRAALARKILGRQCAGCSRTDAEATWSPRVDYCGGCARRGDRYGWCLCGVPFKSRRQITYCPACQSPPAKPSASKPLKVPSEYRVRPKRVRPSRAAHVGEDAPIESPTVSPKAPWPVNNLLAGEKRALSKLGIPPEEAGWLSPGALKDLGFARLASAARNRARKSKAS